MTDIKDQPAPEPTDGTPIWELVIKDMQERDQLGRERYGTPLQAHNGRDGLVDLYQELLDAVVYTRQLIEERGEPEAPHWEYACIEFTAETFMDPPTCPVCGALYVSTRGARAGKVHCGYCEVLRGNISEYEINRTPDCPPHKDVPPKEEFGYVDAVPDVHWSELPAVTGRMIKYPSPCRRCGATKVKLGELGRVFCASCGVFIGRWDGSPADAEKPDYIEAKVAWKVGYGPDGTPRVDCKITETPIVLHDLENPPPCEQCGARTSMIIDSFGKIWCAECRTFRGVLEDRR